MNLRAALFVLLGTLVAAGLFVAFRPTTSAVVTRAPATPPARVAVRAATASAPAELVVQQGRLVAGDPVLKVVQGERVTLRVRSDIDDELHLHGYDLHLVLKAGQPGSLAFVADRSGRFGFELHHAGIELGALEVQPR